MLLRHFRVYHGIVRIQSDCGIKTKDRRVIRKTYRVNDYNFRCLRAITVIYIIAGWLAYCSQFIYSRKNEKLKNIQAQSTKIQKMCSNSSHSLWYDCSSSHVIFFLVRFLRCVVLGMTRFGGCFNDRVLSDWPSPTTVNWLPPEFPIHHSFSLLRYSMWLIHNSHKVLANNDSRTYDGKQQIAHGRTLSHYNTMLLNLFHQTTQIVNEGDMEERKKSNCT